MEDTRTKQIVTTSVRNIVCNLVLAGLKIAAGVLAASVAVLSDGLNSLADAATTVVVLISSRFTGAEGDSEHQYGHEKIESIITLLLAIFLSGSAVYTGYESIVRLVEGTSVALSYFALGSVLFSAAVKLYLYKSTTKVARALDSDTLMLVAADYRFDILLSLSVFAGVLLSMLGLWYFEPIAALFASAILIKTALSFFVKAFNQLVDRAADSATEQLIRDTILACDGVCGIDLLMTRRYGSYVYVDLEISVQPDITVAAGHAVAEHVHDMVETIDGLKIKHCMIHVNPAEIE